MKIRIVLLLVIAFITKEHAMKSHIVRGVASEEERSTTTEIEQLKEENKALSECLADQVERMNSLKEEILTETVRFKDILDRFTPAPRFSSDQPLYMQQPTEQYVPYVYTPSFTAPTYQYDPSFLQSYYQYQYYTGRSYQFPEITSYAPVPQMPAPQHNFSMRGNAPQGFFNFNQMPTFTNQFMAPPRGESTRFFNFEETPTFAINLINT